MKLKILIIVLVLYVKAIYAILDKYLKFLDLNLVPKGLQGVTLGDPFFMILGGENAHGIMKYCLF